MKFIRQLNTDWMICADVAGDLAICETDEGAPHFYIPKALAELDQDTHDEIVIEFAQALYLEKDRATERGVEHGKYLVRREVQLLLGLERIAVAVEQLEPR